MKSFINLWDHYFNYSKADPVKHVLKYVASIIPIQLLRRLEPYALMASEFSALRDIPTFARRSDIWDEALESIAQKELVYIEFGVFQGESIKYFAAKNDNPDSLFLGLDSFEGLPEAWAGNPKGVFSTFSKTPDLDDPRVRFINGWFVDSWAKLDFDGVLLGNLMVHFDADLYSSTMFALSSIDSLKQDYWAVFDEFSGQEASALSDYLAAYDAKVEFIAKQNWRGYPEVVLCKIRPHKIVNEFKTIGIS